MPSCKACNRSYGIFELKDGMCKSCLNASTPECSKCGNRFSSDDLSNGMCSKCLSQTERENALEADRKALQKKIDNVLITTESCSALSVDRRLGIVSAECVLGMNVLTDFLSSFTDTFGGRSLSQQSAMSNAKGVVLAELKQEAHRLGANAVLATQFSYNQLSGGTKSMLFVTAIGTAAVVAEG